MPVPRPYWNGTRFREQVFLSRAAGGSRTQHVLVGARRAWVAGSQFGQEVCSVSIQDGLAIGPARAASGLTRYGWDRPAAEWKRRIHDEFRPARPGRRVARPIVRRRRADAVQGRAEIYTQRRAADWEAGVSGGDLVAAGVCAVSVGAEDGAVHAADQVSADPGDRRREIRA